MASTKSRADTLECQILKQLREDLISAGRWAKQTLFRGTATGEWFGHAYGEEEDRWMQGEWNDWEMGGNAQTLLVGKAIAWKEPETPSEALKSLMLKGNDEDDEYRDEDEALPQVKGVAIKPDWHACLVGGVYIAAGQLGVEDAEAIELIQVMVATGRAVQAHQRVKYGQPELSTEEIERSGLRYDLMGLAKAEEIIIGFNDDQDTAVEDIDDVIKRADIELACIRDEAVEAVPA